MNRRAPFQPQDLAELDDRLLDRALAVVTMAEVHAGIRNHQVVGLRHDVDNVIEPAVRFAEWEAERGYRSTYYILHTAPYWQDKLLLQMSLERICELGHEIGIHNNAVAASLVEGRAPEYILSDAVEELRGYGFVIRGTVAHGDSRCYADASKLRFVNDEMFRECPRPTIGHPNREIGGYQLGRVSLDDFDLAYDANWVGTRSYLSDSGGVWSQPGFDQTAAGFPFPDRQLHMLVHPDWWGDAFTRELAA